MLAFQSELCPELPPVVGNKDFCELDALLTRVDELIVQSGLEGKFVGSFSKKQRKTQNKRKGLVVALRCTIIRLLFQLPYRRAARELATNYLYQKFCDGTLTQGELTGFMNDDSGGEGEGEPPVSCIGKAVHRSTIFRRPWATCCCWA